MNRPAVVIDSASLSPSEAARLRELATRAKAAPPVTESQPDSLQYALTIDDGSIHRSIELDELVAEPWRGFLNYVIELAGKRASGPN